MTIKQAENFITAAAQAGIAYEDAAELIQSKLQLTSEQWGEMLQLWECETALAEED